MCMDKFYYIYLIIKYSTADFVHIWGVSLGLLIRNLTGSPGVLDCAIYQISLTQTCKFVWCHEEDGNCSHLHKSTVLDTDLKSQQKPPLLV